MMLIYFQYNHATHTGFWKAYPPIAKLGLSFSDMANPSWYYHPRKRRPIVIYSIIAGFGMTQSLRLDSMATDWISTEKLVQSCLPFLHSLPLLPPLRPLLPSPSSLSALFPPLFCSPSLPSLSRSSPPPLLLSLSLSLLPLHSPLSLPSSLSLRSLPSLSLSSPPLFSYLSLPSFTPLLSYAHSILQYPIRLANESIGCLLIQQNDRASRYCAS